MRSDRPLCSDAAAIASGFGDAACSAGARSCARRSPRFAPPCRLDRWQRLAAANLARWRAAAVPGPPQVRVLAGDWGAATLELTRRHGACFAVLNMANAHVPGGAYAEGAVAQEENMWRCSDCHFALDPEHLDATSGRYTAAATRLLEGRDGRVHLDTLSPRCCLRGPEDRDAADLGYAWLRDDEVFPFYELRAAAQDLRDGRRFDAAESRRRIVAQLDTLRDHGVRHAVLGAFGCGAFRNPAAVVARLYRDELDARRRDFDVVAFAIWYAGYGPDNFTPFRSAFADA